MKKRLFLLFIALLLCGSALAEGIDWASMTDEELYTAIDAAQAELRRRAPAEPAQEGSQILLIDTDEVKCWLTGEYSVYGPEDDYLSLSFPAILENNSDRVANVFFESCVINGWEAEGLALFETRPGHKEKSWIEISLLSSEIKSLDEVESIVSVISLYDDNWETYWMGEPFTIRLGDLREVPEQ